MAANWKFDEVHRFRSSNTRTVVPGTVSIFKGVLRCAFGRAVPVRSDFKCDELASGTAPNGHLICGGLPVQDHSLVCTGASSSQKFGFMAPLLPHVVERTDYANKRHDENMRPELFLLSVALVSYLVPRLACPRCGHEVPEYHM